MLGCCALHVFVCVCVCQTLSLRAFLVFKAGAYCSSYPPYAMKLGMTREGWTDHPPVPASTGEYATLFQSFFFDSMVVHDTSPKPFFPTAALQPRLCVRLQTLFNHTVLANLFALPFPHHFRPGNWANWKPMSKCEPLSRPTWVLGSLRKSCNGFISSTAPYFHLFITESTDSRAVGLARHDTTAAGLKNGIPLEVRHVSQPPPPISTPYLIRVTEGNGTRHTCVSAPFPLVSLF